MPSLPASSRATKATGDSQPLEMQGLISRKRLALTEALTQLIRSDVPKIYRPVEDVA